MWSVYKTKDLPVTNDDNFERSHCAGVAVLSRFGDVISLFQLKSLVRAPAGS